MNSFIGENTEQQRRAISASVPRWAVGGRVLLAGIAVLLVHSAFIGSARCQEGIGVWDGALWRFEMIPRAGNPAVSSYRGLFRISDLKVYQAENQDDKELKKQVGVSKPERIPKPNRTQLQLTDFRAVDRTRKIHTGMKGVAVLNRESSDKCSGNFTTQDGYKWELKCTRVRE
jgi:hypothetical protein